MTAQLINAEDGYHLWSERYDRELTDVFAIQDEIAQAIAAALQLKLISKPARHTPNFPAYEALLKARHHARTYLPEAHARAKEYCEQAIALDPEYAAPHALLGFNYLLATTHTGRPMPEVAPLIRREARRALELDPFETDPHFLLGAVAAVHDYDWPEAAREFQLAMASPSVPAEAHWAYACLYLSTFGRFEESTAEMRRAVEQDPLSVIWRGVLMAHLVCAGRYEEALQEGLKALDISQNEIHPHLAIGRSLSGVGESRRSRRLRGESASQPPAAIHGHWVPCGLLWSGLEKRTGQRRSSAKWVTRQLPSGAAPGTICCARRSTPPPVGTRR